MKNLIVLVALALVALVAFAASPAFAATEVVFAWTNPNSATVWPACTATLTTMCLVNVELEDVTSPTSVVIATPAPASTGYTLTPLPAAGVRTYALFYNAKDATGAATVSPQSTVAVTIPGTPPVAPAGFTATIK